MLFALLSLAAAKPPVWSLVPFGVGVYVHGKPVRGAVYTATQAAGFATLTVATIKAYEAAEVEDEDTFAQWQTISIAGVTVAVSSYLIGALDGSRLHEIEMENNAAADRVRQWDVARASAVSVR
jgi:hypothetical protein